MSAMTHQSFRLAPIGIAIAVALVPSARISAAGPSELESNLTIALDGAARVPPGSVAQGRAISVWSSSRTRRSSGGISSYSDPS